MIDLKKLIDKYPDCTCPKGKCKKTSDGNKVLLKDGKLTIIKCIVCITTIIVIIYQNRPVIQKSLEVFANIFK